MFRIRQEFDDPFGHALLPQTRAADYGKRLALAKGGTFVWSAGLFSPRGELEGGRGTGPKDSWEIRGEGCLKNHKNREEIDKKTMLKTSSENDAKTLPKGSQKGCQEVSKSRFWRKKWVQKAM